MNNNPFAIGNKVTVIGYDSTGMFNHNFLGLVTDVNDETCKVLLERGYHARVAYQQCTLVEGTGAENQAG